MYDPKSLKAEEFIDHEEILASLAYADEHKDDLPLIDEILEKAKLRKGLSHRDASVLLACETPEKVQEIYALAEQIKKDFYFQTIHIRISDFSITASHFRFSRYCFAEIPSYFLKQVAK